MCVCIYIYMYIYIYVYIERNILLQNLQEKQGIYKTLMSEADCHYIYNDLNEGLVFHPVLS